MWNSTRRGARGLFPAAITLGAGLAAASSLAPAADLPTSGAIVRNHIECPATRAALDRVAEGALRRLRRPECQRVFSDFTDGNGRPLRERLQALAETGDGYLAARMWFVDGSGARACQDRQTLAVTRPGSSVVFVCARQLRERAFNDPAFVEASLIHEQLHSLGLGENPPTSLEITAQVQRRCGAR
jgi:hypothetical protein